MKLVLLASAAALALLLPTLASADDRASDAARRMSPDAVAQRLLDAGFSEVRRVEPAGRHYAVAAVGPDGAAVAFHADPATGDLVHNVSSGAGRESRHGRDHH